MKHVIYALAALLRFGRALLLDTTLHLHMWGETGSRNAFWPMKAYQLVPSSPLQRMHIRRPQGCLKPQGVVAHESNIMECA